MDVYWLEQSEKDVPAENDWLNENEAVRLNSLRFAKRRADWRLGRWTAKHAVALCLNLSPDRQGLANIEIRAAPSGAPEVFLANEQAGPTISLSHRAGTAVCAVVLSRVALGCDLEIIEPRSDAFIRDYFTAEEQALVAATPEPDRLSLVALLWSAKESVLKALQEGLRLDTRSVIVCPLDEDDESAAGTWRRLRVSDANGQVFHGWWRRTHGLMRTVVAAPPPCAPTLLNLAAASTKQA